jgi:hypothetical protein
MKVDLVYLWVDGNDLEWQAKRKPFQNVSTEIDVSGKCRYIDNDELRYSLRSVEKYAPWINKIFIVTDNQIPKWLNQENDKIKIIDHKDILPQDALPCFNSSVIEHFLYKIPELSEHFLFANDDMFFNDYLDTDYFFKKDGYPIVYLNRRILGKMHYRLKVWVESLKDRKPYLYREIVDKAACLVEKKFGKFYAGIPHRNIDSYKKSDFAEAIGNVFRQESEKTKVNHTRTRDDLHRSVVSYYVLAIKHAHLQYVDPKKNMHVSVSRPNLITHITKHRPKLVCIDDDSVVTDMDRQKMSSVLEKLFPEKSAFEK